MAQKADPKVSIELLNELTSRGFSNELYVRLHHLEYDTINAHISYCKRIKEFKAGGTNALVQSRLRFIRDKIDEKCEPGTLVDAATFQGLVDAALKLYPL